MMISAIQNIVDRLKSGHVGQGEAVDLLKHPSPIIRANAILNIAVLAASNPELVQNLVDAAKDPANSFHLMGTISVAHIAVGSIAKIQSSSASIAVRELFDKWPSSDRDDLCWYLKSEGYDPEPSAVTGCHGP